MGGCWSTTRQIVTAVSAVWQCHLAVTAAPGRQGQSRPGSLFTSRWGTAPGTGGGHSPPAPTRAADPSRGGQGDRPLPPASALGTAGAQRPEQSPFVQVSLHPLLSLGRHPKPSRNRTQPGSAFESPQEGSAELPKADEHPPSTPLNQSHSSVLRVQGLARLRADPLGARPTPLISRHHPVPQFLHLSVEGPGRLSRAPREPIRYWRRAEPLAHSWHREGTGAVEGAMNSSLPGPRGGRSCCKVADSAAKGRGYF